ncbi:MAG: hypothetical protein FGM24_09920 [Candidatus Kapabacteria bacterium]|nr:hypothetical protein [Candidatus Kapabacteria bacterium]
MVLFTFVGTTDVKLIDEAKGPALTAVLELKPRQVVLIATTGDGVRFDLIDGAARFAKLVKRVAPATRTSIVTMDIDDPTDHNEIYPKLREIVQSHSNTKSPLVASISSGTPSMQVCWILLAESGDAGIKLYRTIERELTDKPLREVRLDSSLPRIRTLEAENKQLRQIAIRPIEILIDKGMVKVGQTIIDLSPIQFAYYRFFLERIKAAKGGSDPRYRVSARVMDDEFVAKVDQYLKESFPDRADSDGTYGKKKSKMTPTENFRSTISKLNRKFTDALDEDLAEYYTIRYIGPRQARSYGLRLEHTHVRIR